MASLDPSSLLIILSLYVVCWCVCSLFFLFFVSFFFLKLLFSLSLSLNVQLLHLIRERPNVCRSIHIPAQSGSTAVLDRMRRNHTSEAYIELIDHIREIVPDVSLSSDFISGFCGETEEDHQQTLR
jgi:tRNA A37 methylthiotransferase MiaB